MRQTAEEIMVRIEIAKRKQQRRRLRLYSGSLLALMAVLVVCLSTLPSSQTIRMERSLFGAFLLDPGMGGYVLVAVIGFTAGVILAVVIQKYRTLHKEIQNKDR